MKSVFELEFEGKKFVVEAGEIAKQADGAVLVRLNETVVLSTACASDLEVVVEARGMQFGGLHLAEAVAAHVHPHLRCSCPANSIPGTTLMAILPRPSATSRCSRHSVTRSMSSTSWTLPITLQPAPLEKATWTASNRLKVTFFISFHSRRKRFTKTQSFLS